MSEQTLNKWRAIVLAAAPPVFLAGVLIQPYIGDWSDSAAIARAIEADPPRMALASVVLGFSAGVTVLAVFAIRGLLRSAGENSWSPIGVALATLGGVLVATATGGGLPLALAAQAGQSVEPIVRAGEGWAPVQLGGFVVFALAFVVLAVAIYRSDVLSTGLRWLVAVALVVAGVGTLLPFGFGFYIAAGGSFLGAWPLAYAAWGAGQRAASAIPAGTP